MDIEFERSGGFAGLSLQLQVNTASLPEEEGRELLEMVNQSGFFTFPKQGGTSDSGADQFNYKLTVDTGERKHTMEMTDASAPATLQPLLKRLTRMARSGRYSTGAGNS